MKKVPSKAVVEQLRKQYPAGTRVELISMDDPYANLKPGDRGSIDFFDDTGTAFVTWDNGLSLGLVYGADHFKATAEGPSYESGAHFWRSAAISYGRDEALVIGGNYLATQLKLETSAGEKQFCRELFAAMYEDSARIADPAKIVYPYTVSQAKGRLENSCYAESARYNAECAAAIDAAIKSSCYKSDHYHLDIAAMAAIHAHGFERVNAVLAHQIRQAKSDGRYSGANKAWALLPGFDYPETALNGAYLRSHAVLINDFTDYARKLYSGLGAERFALPGCEECGTAVQGYEITRSIWFDDRRGFAIGHSPIAPAPHVCWQFTTENGKREFYWGTYGGEKEAADNYRVRIIAHMNDGDVKEIPPPLAAAKMTSEQSYDMAPESRAVVGREERLSTLAQIRAAKAAPKPPRKAKETDPHKHKNGAEL